MPCLQILRHNLYLVLEFNSHVANDFATVAYNKLISREYSHVHEDHELLDTATERVEESFLEQFDNENNHHESEFPLVTESIADEVMNHYRHSLSNLGDDDMAIAVNAIGCVNYIATRTKRDVLKQSVS